MLHIKTLVKQTCVAATVSTLLATTATSTFAAEDKIRWKVQAVFGTHLPGLGDPIVHVAKQLKAATDGQIQFKVYEPGKIVPPFSITEAVRNHQLDAGYAWLGYDQGRIPASALLSAVPFGMEPWEYSAWWYEGEGKKLAEDLYAKHNVHPVLCSIIGPETAGWFKKEVNAMEDLHGLKIRFAGLGGKVLQKAGASVTVLPSGEIFPALEKGAIDATEFSMPAIDKIMGFDKVAKNNYFPGWHQTFTASHLVINKDVWDDLASSTKATIDMACTASTFRALTHGEAIQGKVLNELQEKGIKTQTLNTEMLTGLKNITNQVMSELSAEDEDFKKIYDSQQSFRAEYKAWRKLAYLPLDL
ncbi:C4-dicarboxylate ABC transporter [Marinomonas mediterranea]|jgi:TRAP-type mannitol/chloroaromatic compound transport system, periplasmic component|uniref:Extracellular solute-binding protein, family 7 n=1 Tax=Marinomonas mediterranea (strain ATCC 700492 / JCM 21426 / NBRC 103028 / MMB-1) TaxID=717774 RepID=F2K4P4_MARM1|nr:TRAP transporter substrate-binding protein [Marinomonas mediterranea]ADZ91437.1 Extracellular solute-binding protein, family 7 [Marinomonas mediterranea MMB-1]WCN13481.1 C4-dicarboxylate ABC transporter [Marinomonas mediterranea]WCN17546.1 C4-dicarboxylate ABC transporter [Marinomonas mediterranea MMB-1]